MPTPTGFSAQYLTLATALSISWQEYHAFKESVIKAGEIDLESIDATSARRVTIVVLSAALCESVINTYFSLKFDASCWALLEKAKPVDKWASMPRLLFPNYTFPNGTILDEDLKMLFACRNSIMHARPEVSAGKEKLHKGNVGDWLQVDRYVDRFYDLALRLLKHLEQFDSMGAVIHSSSLSSHLLPPRSRPPTA